jgi:hypothetical protein
MWGARRWIYASIQTMIGRWYYGMTYSIANTDEVCPRPYISGIKVNNAGYTVILKVDEIVKIGK